MFEPSFVFILVLHVFFLYYKLLPSPSFAIIQKRASWRGPFQNLWWRHLKILANLSNWGAKLVVESTTHLKNMLLKSQIGWKSSPKNRGENNIYYIYMWNHRFSRRGLQGLLVIMRKLISLKTRRRGDHSMANKPILPVAVPPCSASLLFGWRWVHFFRRCVGFSGDIFEILVSTKKIGWQTKSCWKMHRLLALAFFWGKCCLFLNQEVC